MSKRITVEVPDGRKLLTTEEAAQLLNRRPQTLRLWAAGIRKPFIEPVRVGGRLGWRPEDIEAALNGEINKDEA